MALQMSFRSGGYHIHAPQLGTCVEAPNNKEFPIPSPHVLRMASGKFGRQGRNEASCLKNWHRWLLASSKVLEFLGIKLVLDL